MRHPLLEPAVRHDIEAAVSGHLGRPWQITSWLDLVDRASHPALVLRGSGFAVFAKLADRSEAVEQIESELRGLRLIGERSGVGVPTPIGGGRLDLGDGSAVLLFQALDERVQREPEDWRAIGRALAQLHQVSGESFGETHDGFFGPLRQDNRPVPSNRWVDFYADRRVLPWLRTARDAGSIDAETAAKVETLVARLPELVGPEPEPRLLHGDAQHHNFVSTPNGAVIIDPAPYFGHPELDLALLDYFSPVPADAWAGYREVRPIDPGFAERRELWRVFAYLAILTVDGQSDFGRTFAGRLDRALDHYIG
jgi:fructosamine-3-kinase